jgi:hypothetical protein
MGFHDARTCTLFEKNLNCGTAEVEIAQPLYTSHENEQSQSMRRKSTATSD